jgi:lipid II:glycine glycyltransferase (peptidoglycan interpeptide bridge formation enzyme)
MYDALMDECAVVPAEGSATRLLYRIDPLKDPRWELFLNDHPHASVFHSRAWLEALRRTYGYDSIAYTTSSPAEDLQNGVVFCRVESWLTGRRLVSVPFSDHCAPLIRNPEDARFFFKSLEEEAREGKWRYIEMRPLETVWTAGPDWHSAMAYTLHQLDLTPDLQTLFNNFHKSSVQRKVRRAEREGLEYQEGTTRSLLDSFYHLLAITRRRHQVPPQPKAWFQNLSDCFGESLKIRIASKGDRPVAGMLTIRYKDTLVYKYGGSDTRFNNLGGMHLLYWKAMQDAKNSGLRTFDLGRSDYGQDGLITFKSRWGAKQSVLTYIRFGVAGNAEHVFDPSGTSWKMRIVKQVFAHAPTRILSALGSILYKHVG